MQALVSKQDLLELPRSPRGPTLLGVGVIVGRARRDRLFLAEAPRCRAAAVAAVTVIVIGHVIVAVLVIGYANVGVIDAVDDLPSGRSVEPLRPCRP
jgi:hypothetical protein